MYVHCVCTYMIKMLSHLEVVDFIVVMPWTRKCEFPNNNIPVFNWYAEKIQEI